MSQRISTDANILKAMEVFLAVLESGQMTSAARMVGMTQSAVSQQVATLERHYGAQLLDRSTRPVRATQAGLLMQRHALSILNSVADLAADMRHQGPHPISVLRLGLLASIATTLTPPLVGLAQTEFGVQDMTLHAGQSEDHETLLRTKQADIVISSNPFYDMAGLERHNVLSESFLLVLPQGYDGPTDTLAQVMERLPLVRFADSTEIGRRIRQHLRRLKLQPTQVIQADRSSMVTACVAEGMGFTLLTPTLLLDGLVERMPLEVLPMPGPGTSRGITVVAREKELGSLPLRFAETARAILEDRIRQEMGPVGIVAMHPASTEP